MLALYILTVKVRSHYEGASCSVKASKAVRVHYTYQSDVFFRIIFTSQRFSLYVLLFVYFLTEIIRSINGYQLPAICIGYIPLHCIRAYT